MLTNEIKCVILHRKKQLTMTRYYNSNGAFLYEDSTTDIEEVKRVLEEKDLCIAIVEAEGKMIKVQRGKYNEKVLIHCGQAYWVN